MGRMASDIWEKWVSLTFPDESISSHPLCCLCTLLSLIQTTVGSIQMLSRSVKKGAFSASTWRMGSAWASVG